MLFEKTRRGEAVRLMFSFVWLNVLIHLSQKKIRHLLAPRIALRLRGALPSMLPLGMRWSLLRRP